MNIDFWQAFETTGYLIEGENRLVAKRQLAGLNASLRSFLAAHPERRLDAHLECRQQRGTSPQGEPSMSACLPTGVSAVPARSRMPTVPSGRSTVPSLAITDSGDSAGPQAA